MKKNEMIWDVNVHKLLLIRFQCDIYWNIYLSLQTKWHEQKNQQKRSILLLSAANTNNIKNDCTQN